MIYFLTSVDLSLHLFFDEKEFSSHITGSEVSNTGVHLCSVFIPLCLIIYICKYNYLFCVCQTWVSLVVHL